MQQILKEIIQWVRAILKKTFHRDNPSFSYYLTLVVSFVIFVTCMNIFVEITEDLRENELEHFDAIYTERIQSLRNPSRTVFFQFVTELGDRLTYILLSLGIALFFYLRFGNWKFTLQTIIVLILSSFSNLILKRVINRERPDLEHLVAVSTLSYPSGHAMSAMAFYGFLIYLSFRFKLSLLFRSFIVILLGILILLIGVSRIYLGVHFPSDVLAGFFGGLIWVTFCIIVFNVVDLYRKRKNYISFRS